jgi:Flp pilus assembly protein TadD
MTLGDLYQHQEDGLDAAIRHFEAAMKHDSTAAYACNNLAVIYTTRRSEPKAGLALAEQAVSLSGSQPQMLDTLGWAHYVNGNYAEAVECLEEAKRGIPSHPSLRFHLGMAYAKVGRMAEARGELEEALGLSGSFAEADRARETLQALSQQR